jgi:uncharacterized repeat protein (TIGR02543 family)
MKRGKAMRSKGILLLVLLLLTYITGCKANLPSEDLTLITIQPTYVTVIFDGNGGTPSIASVSVKVDSVLQYNIAIRNGYTFEGWYKDIELEDKWDFTTDLVTSSITLYAKWKNN